MPIIQIFTAGTFWPEIETASLHVKVQSQDFGMVPPDLKVFHERRMEVLKGGGDPVAIFDTMQRHSAKRWEQLIGIWTHF